MIASYDPNIAFGVHTIRFTLMQWNYVGHIAVKIQGNCKGAALLEPCYIVETDEEDVQYFVENDCKFVIEDGVFSTELRNKMGQTLEVEDFLEELENLIVGIEIVDFV